MRLGDEGLSVAVGEILLGHRWLVPGFEHGGGPVAPIGTPCPEQIAEKEIMQADDARHLREPLQGTAMKVEVVADVVDDRVRIGDGPLDGRTGIPAENRASEGMRRDIEQLLRLAAHDGDLVTEPSQLALHQQNDAADRGLPGARAEDDQLHGSSARMVLGQVMPSPFHRLRAAAP